MVANLYLPDDCWECVFKFLIKHDNNYNGYLFNGNNRPYFNFKSLSLVSKQFLSITNRIRFSLTIRRDQLTHHFPLKLFSRFSNLTSLELVFLHGDIDMLLRSICLYPLKITSLNLSRKFTFPADALRAFSKNTTTTLTSLTCTTVHLINDTDLLLIADCFPLLEELELSFPGCVRDHCYCKSSGNCISQEGIGHILRCHKIRHLNLMYFSRFKLRRIFEVSKLEVLILSYTQVDDKTLYMVSKSCRGLLQLLMENCYQVTEKGVKHVVENCTQLR